MQYGLNRICIMFGESILPNLDLNLSIQMTKIARSTPLVGKVNFLSFKAFCLLHIDIKLVYSVLFYCVL